MQRLRELAERTPPQRERHVDLLRALAITAGTLTATADPRSCAGRFRPWASIGPNTATQRAEHHREQRQPRHRHMTTPGNQPGASATSR